MAIEIEVTYSSHSYWYCNCDWIVDTVATAIGIEIVFSCDNNWYCSCDWTLYAASIAIETEIESPMLEELKLKLISTSKLWYYCYCSRSWTTCKKIPKSYRALKKGIVQPWSKQSRFLYLLYRLCQQVPSLVRCAKDSFSSTKEKYNMAFVKLSILRKLIPAYSSLLHSRRSKSKKRRSRNYISRGNPIVFIKYYYYH